MANGKGKANGVTREHPNVHARRDLEKLHLHQRIAEVLRRDPDRVLRIAAENLRRWQANGGEQPYYQEWERILATRSVDEIAHILIANDSTGRALRQSTPFVGVLPERQQNEILGPNSSATARTVERSEDLETRAALDERRRKSTEAKKNRHGKLY